MANGKRTINSPNINDAERKSVAQRINDEVSERPVWSSEPTSEFLERLEILVPDMSHEELKEFAKLLLYAARSAGNETVPRSEIVEKLARIQNCLEAIASLHFNANDGTLIRLVNHIVGPAKDDPNIRMNFDEKYRMLFSRDMERFCYYGSKAIIEILPHISPRGRQVKTSLLAARKAFAFAWRKYSNERPVTTLADNGEVEGVFPDVIRLSLRELPADASARIETENFIRETVRWTQRYYNRSTKGPNATIS